MTDLLVDCHLGARGPRAAPVLTLLGLLIVVSVIAFPLNGLSPHAGPLAATPQVATAWAPTSSTVPSSPPSSIPDRERPRALLPTDTAMVYTTDPLAGDNRFLSMAVLLPEGNLIRGENWTFWLADPLNATTTIAIGLLGFENGTTPTWWLEYAIWNDQGRPGNTTVVDESSPFRGGENIDLDIIWDHGPWWTFSDSTAPVEGLGGNGTVDLGTDVAVGYSPTTPLVQWPTLVVQGNTTTMPWQARFSSILQYNASENPPDPLNCTWLAQNAIWWQSSPGWRVAGEDQIGTVEYDGFAWALDFGEDVPAAPANGTWLWGIGGPLVRPYANVTLEGAFAANTGFGFELAGNGSTVGPGAASYVITIWERIAPGISVGVGAWVNGPNGQTLPFYEKNVSGEPLQYLADTNTPAEGRSVLVLAWSQPGGQWNFSANGAVLQGGEDSYALGEEYVGPTVAPQGSEVYLTIDSVGTIPAGAPGFPLSPTILLNVSGTWETPPEGYVGPTSPPPCSPCRGSQVEGYQQDALLAPGEVVAQPGLPTLSVGTPLWNGTVFPTAQLGWTGVPEEVGSFENLSATIWVNGSSGPLAAPQVVLQLPAGVSSGVIWFPATGGASVNLTFPVAGSDTPLTLLAWGGAPGYVVGAATQATLLVPGALSVVGHLAGPPLASGAAGTILVWVNATDGAGPRTVGSLTPSSSLSASLVPEGLVSGSTAFAFGYTAPATTEVINDTVSIFADMVGFEPTLGVVKVPIAPFAMAISARAVTPQVPSAAPILVDAWLNASSGTPLPGATIFAGFPEEEGATQSTSSPTPGEYTFEIIAPQISVNASLELTVGATLAGYRTTSTVVSVEVVLEVLSVHVSVAAPVQGAYAIQVRATYAGAGVADALATLLPSGGTLLAGSVQAGPSGEANFTWIAPSGQSGTFSFLVSVSAPSFLPASRTFTINVPSSGGSTSSPSSGISDLWLLIGPALVLVVFLVLWAIGRRKYRQAGMGPVPGEGKGTPPSSEKKEEKDDEAEKPADKAGPSEGSPSEVAAGKDAVKEDSSPLPSGEGSEAAKSPEASPDPVPPEAPPTDPSP